MCFLDLDRCDPCREPVHRFAIRPALPPPLPPAPDLPESGLSTTVIPLRRDHDCGQPIRARSGKGAHRRRPPVVPVTLLRAGMLLIGWAVLLWAVTR